MKKHIFLLIVVVLFASCSDKSEDHSYLSNGSSYFEPRISIEGISGGLLQFNVLIEGPNGDAITGANVTVRDLINRTQVLYFNSENHCYIGTMQDIKDVTLYTITINSSLLKKPMTVNVPFLQFQNKPAITVLRDESGYNALSGFSLNKSKSIQIAWTSSGVNTVYQVIVRTSLQVVYSVVTEDITVTIPENTLNSESYIVNIKAQKICGDPLYQDYNYYSISTENSMDVAFNVF